MRRPSQLPPELGSAFSTEDGLKAGVSRQRSRAVDLATPFRGIRTALPIETTSDRARAYSTRMPDAQFFSHLTAAELLGLRLPERFRPGLLEVTSIAPLRASRGAGIVGHQASSGETIIVDGLRVSSPLMTWLDLGAFLPLDDLIVMGDGLLSRLAPRCTPSQVESALRDHARRRGHARLTEAWASIRPRTDSARESMLRLLVVRAGFPEPEVNPEIRNQFDAVIAHGDLTYPEYKVILEYDGGGHRTDERQFHIDIDRLDALMEEGWRVIRVNKSLMARHATLCGKIDTALRDRGWIPSSS